MNAYLQKISVIAKMLMSEKGERGQLGARHKQEEGELLTKQVKIKADKNR